MSAYTRKIVTEHRKAAKKAAKVQAEIGDGYANNTQHYDYNAAARNMLLMQEQGAHFGMRKLLEDEAKYIFELAHATGGYSGLVVRIQKDLKSVQTKIRKAVAAS